MKKILIPVKASEELPEKSGYYETSFGSKLFDAKHKTFCGISGNSIGYWYKIVSEEDYLREKLEAFSEYLDFTASETSHLHMNDIDELIKLKT